MLGNESDVFIAGSGIPELYASLLLSKLGLNVYTSERNKERENTDELLILSPRTIHLLKQLDLLDGLKGHYKHWKLDVYQIPVNSNQIHDIKQSSIKLWENDMTEDSYCISCEKSILYNLLKSRVKIDENQEILDINHYQYKPLPHITKIPPQNDVYVKSIHLKDTATQTTKTVRSKFIIVADSLLRQKLGVCLINQSTTLTRIFYTLDINIVHTNFPSTRQIACIYKKKDIIYIIGHQSKLYITFEHKPSWSKTSIDEEIPVNVAIDHIKYMLDPFKIEFGKVNGYTKWHASDQSICEEYSLDASHFLIGSCAQNIHPPGLFDINVSIEQIQLLCWKLALTLKTNSTNALIDQTIDVEARSKSMEAIHTSTVFTNLICDYMENNNPNSTSHTLDFMYQLNRMKACFIGHSQLPANILNHTFEEDQDFDGESTFEFTASIPSQLATPGSLAPNAKLKPYTLFQLLSLNNQTTIQPKSVAPEESKQERTKRSNSLGNTKWTSVLPIFQRGNNNTNNNNNNNNNTHKRTSVHTKSPSITEGWKSIKPNHLQLIRQMSNTKFTLLVFCGSIENQQLRNLNQKLHGFCNLYHEFLSVLFITNSSKQDAIKYLSNTPPSIVHTTFQTCGLDCVFLDHDQQCYRMYGIDAQKCPEIVVIRPDGYIGTRIMAEHYFDNLNIYFNAFLNPSIDMNSAAAVVADGYDYDL